MARFGRGEIILTTRPATGEPAEEGLADVIVGKEESEDSAILAAASRATRWLIRRALKTVARETPILLAGCVLFCVPRTKRLHATASSQHKSDVLPECIETDKAKKID